MTKKERDTLKSMKNIDTLFVLTEAFTYPEHTEFLSRNIAYIQDNGSYILAVNRDRYLGIWSKKSTFLGAVGSIGKGPGEFISPWGAFFEKDKLFVIDGALKVLHQYDIPNNKIIFNDRVDISHVLKLSPISVVPYGQYYYFIYASMWKGSPRIVKVDSSFKTINSYAEISIDENVSVMGTWKITPSYVIVTDAWRHEKGKNTLSYDSNINIYNHNGKIIRKINRNNKEIVSLICDENEKFLILRYDDRYEIFAIDNGKKIIEVKRNSDLEKSMYPNFYSSEWGSYFYTLTHDEVKKTMTFSKYTVKL